MTRELMSLADGKLVLALEGGYELSSICDATEMCIKALMGEDVSRSVSYLSYTYTNRKLDLSLAAILKDEFLLTLLHTSLP